MDEEGTLDGMTDLKQLEDDSTADLLRRTLLTEPFDDARCEALLPEPLMEQSSSPRKLLELLIMDGTSIEDRTLHRMDADDQLRDSAAKLVPPDGEWWQADEWDTLLFGGAPDVPGLSELERDDEFDDVDFGGELLLSLCAALYIADRRLHSLLLLFV